MPSRSPGLVASATLSVALVLSCGAPVAMARPLGGGSSVVVRLTDSSLTVEPGTVRTGTVAFRIVNRGRAARDFRIAGSRTRKLPPGASTTLEVVLTTGGPAAYASIGPGGRHRLGGELNVIDPCTSPAATTVSVQLAQGDGGLSISRTSVPCGTVTFVVSNVGTQVDSLQVFEAELPPAKGLTPELAPGQTATLAIDFAVKGTVVCQSSDYPPPEPEYGGDYGELAQLAVV